MIQCWAKLDDDKNMYKIPDWNWIIRYLSFSALYSLLVITSPGFACQKTIDLYQDNSNIWFARICKNNWKCHCSFLICETQSNSHSHRLEHNVKWNFDYKVSVLSLFMQTFAIDNWNSTFSYANYILRQNCKLNSNRNLNCQIARMKAEK